MQEFMEVYTATFLMYACIIPSYLALLGIIYMALGQLLTLNASNLMLCIIVFLFVTFSMNKVLKCFDKTPYVAEKNIKFKGSSGNDKIIRAFKE